MRAVEGKVARLRLGPAGPVIWAREVHRHLDLFAFVRNDDHGAATQTSGGLDRLDEPRALVRAHHDAIHDDLDVVLLVLVERDLLAQLLQATVNPEPNETP